jgi:uncharacterized membrane protein
VSAGRNVDWIRAGALGDLEAAVPIKHVPAQRAVPQQYLPAEVREMLTGWTIVRIGYSLLHFGVMFVARPTAEVATLPVGAGVVSRREAILSAGLVFVVAGRADDLRRPDPSPDPGTPPTTSVSPQPR